MSLAAKLAMSHIPDGGRLASCEKTISASPACAIRHPAIDTVSNPVFQSSIHSSAVEREDPAQLTSPMTTRAYTVLTAIKLTSTQHKPSAWRQTRRRSVLSCINCQRNPQTNAAFSRLFRSIVTRFLIFLWIRCGWIFLMVRDKRVLLICCDNP